MRPFPHGVASEVERLLTPEPERQLPTDPVEWIRQALDEHVWSVQRKILRAVNEHRKVAVQSAHGIGKSYIASREMAYWIAAHPPGESKIISTAPSSHQVRAILWTELQKAHRRGGLPGTITRSAVPEWRINGVQVGFGRKPAEFVDAEAARTQFQGLHARYLLAVLDEAGGVPAFLWEAVETLVTNEASRILAIGNPDDPTSHFAKICSPGSGWHVIKVSAFDTPAFTGERIPEQLRDSLVSKLWVDEREAEWGVESPLYVSKVLGEFPEVADDVIISPKLIREAHENDRSGYAISDPGRYGVDVARFGEDETTVYLNRGGMILEVASWRKLDTDTTRRKVQAILDNHPVPMQIDVVGIGAGVFDPLNHLGYKVIPFSGGERAIDPERFQNRNSEAWWAFREAMEAGLVDLDPDDLTLAAQLQSRKWKLDSAQRRISIESKDEMKRRGIKSPDRADAAVLAYYVGGHTVDSARDILSARRGPHSITDGLLHEPT
jgi:hypothetical protein